MANKPGVTAPAGRARTDESDRADPEQRLPRGAESIASAEGRAPKKVGTGKSKSVVHTWLFNGTDPGSDFELSTLPKLIANSKNLAWVDVCRYTEDELRDLAKLLGLHAVGVDAALAPWQRPRVDTFSDNFFLTVTVVKPNPGKLTVEVGELDLFVGENFLLTLHKGELPFLESIAERVYRSPDLVRYHTAYVVYIVLDEMLDFYQTLFEDLEERIEHIEEHALTDDSDAFLGNLLKLKRYVFLIGRLAEQNRVVFAAITRPDFQFISGPELEPYFRDLQQRLEQTVERLFAARDAVNSAFDIYVSQMSHRTNRTMKLLAVVSTVLLPATLITGIFGTNFAVPPLHSAAALAVMVTALIVVPVTVVLALRANRVL